MNIPRAAHQPSPAPSSSSSSRARGGGGADLSSGDEDTNNRNAHTANANVMQNTLLSLRAAAAGNGGVGGGVATKEGEGDGGNADSGVVVKAGAGVTPGTATLPTPALAAIMPSTTAAFVSSRSTAAANVASSQSGGNSSATAAISMPSPLPPPPQIGSSSAPLSALSADLGREFYRRETLRSTYVLLFIAAVCLFVVPIVGFMLLPVGAGVVYWLSNATRFATGGDQTRCFNRNSCVNFYIILLVATLFINSVDIIFLLVAVFGGEGSAATTAPSSSMLSMPANERSSGKEFDGAASAASADLLASAVGGAVADAVRRSMFAASRTFEQPVTAPTPYTSSSSSSKTMLTDAQYHAAHRSLLFLSLIVNAACGVTASYALYVTRKLQSFLD